MSRRRNAGVISANGSTTGRKQSINKKRLSRPFENPNASKPHRQQGNGLPIPTNDYGRQFGAPPMFDIDFESSRHNGRRTFKDILVAVRAADIVKLKNRAFGANRIAKTVMGRSRELCYGAKGGAINALLKQGAAHLNEIVLNRGEPMIGFVFAGGGMLHTKPCYLDAAARSMLAKQVARSLFIDD